MASKLTAYIINLDGIHDRWNTAVVQVEALGLCYERVPAVDGRGRPLSDFPTYDGAKTRRRYKRDLSGGEIGCYLSHLNALGRFLDSGKDCCIVFEDDFTSNTAAKADILPVFELLSAKAGEAWGLCTIGASHPKRSKVLRKIGDVDISQSYMLPLFSHANFWTRRGALDFVACCANIAEPVDDAIRRWATMRGGALMVTPPLFLQSGADSEIDKQVNAACFGDRRVRNGRRSRIAIKGPLYLLAIWHKLWDRLMRNEIMSK